MLELNRQQLEYQVAAAIEIKRRRSLNKTIFGIVCPDDGLIRCWQDIDGEYQQVDDTPDVKIPLVFERALIIPKPIKVLEGGRGSGKSETVAIIKAAQVKDYGYKVGAFREFQTTIDDSVHSLISRKIEELGFQGFDIQNKRIIHGGGGSVKYRGLARNILGVKSMDDFDGFWVEEAESISYRSIEVLEPTARKKGAEIWYTMNRGSAVDPMSQEHITPYDAELRNNGYYEDDTILVIRCHYTDNPWFPEVLENKRKKNKLRWSIAKYNNIWGGEHLDEIENSIIRQEWFDAAIDAHIKLGFKPAGQKVIAFDPSDVGNDDKALVERHGSVILNALTKSDGNANDACDWAVDYAIKCNADMFTWDCDGMGALLRRQVADGFSGKRIDFEMYKGSEGVEDPDDIYEPSDYLDLKDSRSNKQTFKNKRAQRYIKLADRFFNTYRAVVLQEYVDPDTMISISSSIECIPQMRSEVCHIPLKPSGNGLIQIMTKQEIMSKYKIPSPNIADSLKMSLITPIIKTQYEPLQFESEW